MESFESHQIRQKNQIRSTFFLELLGLVILKNRLDHRYPNFFLFQFLIIDFGKDLL
jgi:hypothetical protein